MRDRRRHTLKSGMAGNYRKGGRRLLAQWLLAGMFLLYWTYGDLRCGMISVKSCLLAAGTGMVTRVVFEDGSAAGFFAGGAEAAWAGCVHGLIPGLFVMGIAVISGEKIGKGDAWMLIALGALVGAEHGMELFVTALAAALPFAALWNLARRRKHRDGQCRRSGMEEERRAIPFAPCLMIAYVLCSL